MPVEVGFSYKGRDYTVERPCMFDTYCTPTDFDQWAAHAGEWVAAIGAKASGPEQTAEYLRIANRYADIVKENQDCRISCTSGTQALISTARLSKTLADSWNDPVTEDEVNTDWGWIGTIKLPFLPGVGDLEEMIRRGVLQRYLPILGVLAVMWLLNSGERSRA